MSNNVQSENEQNRIDALEQRVQELEAQHSEHEAGGVTRRQTLAGLFGGSALLGASGTVGAQSSDNDPPFAEEDHDHSGGHLGQRAPVDRTDSVRLAAGEIYNKAGAEAAIQTSWDGMVVPIAPGLGASDVIDPSATDTPVQDAIDAVSNASTEVDGGRVILPPEPIEEATTIEMKTGVHLLGHGGGSNQFEVNDTPTRASLIQITETGVDLMRFDDGERMQHNRLDGFILRGPRPPGTKNGETDTGVGIHIGPTNGTFVGRCTIDDLQIINLSDSAIRTSPEGGQLVECNFGLIAANGIDAANSNRAVFELSPYAGFSSNIDVLAAYPQDRSSGADSDILRVANGGNLNVNVMNVGNRLGRAVVSGGFGGVLRVNTLNYEPYAQNDSHVVVDTFGSRPFYMGPAIVRGGKLDRYCRIRGPNPENNDIGLYRTNDAVTLSNPEGIVIEDDPTGPNIYHGESADVANTTDGELSRPVSCLGDLTPFHG